jgi:hypothetical protein
MEMATINTPGGMVEVEIPDRVITDPDTPIEYDDFFPTRPVPDYTGEICNRGHRLVYGDVETLTSPPPEGLIHGQFYSYNEPIGINSIFTNREALIGALQVVSPNLPNLIDWDIVRTATYREEWLRLYLGSRALDLTHIISLVRPNYEAARLYRFSAPASWKQPWLSPSSNNW